MRSEGLAVLNISEFPRRIKQSGHFTQFILTLSYMVLFTVPSNRYPSPTQFLLCFLRERHHYRQPPPLISSVLLAATSHTYYCPGNTALSFQGAGAGNASHIILKCATERSPYPYSGLASVEFNATNPLSVLSQAAYMLDSNAFQSKQPCGLHLSGQDGMLPRALYYVLLDSALLFRRREWLAIAALGTATVYAAFAAVHLFTLLSFAQPNASEIPGFDSGNQDTSAGHADPDIFAISPVLAVAVIMLTSILNFSTSIRRHKAQAIVIHWGLFHIYCFGRRDRPDIS